MTLPPRSASAVIKVKGFFDLGLHGGHARAPGQDLRVGDDAAVREETAARSRHGAPRSATVVVKGLAGRGPSASARPPPLVSTVCWSGSSRAASVDRLFSGSGVVD